MALASVAIDFPESRVYSYCYIEYGSVEMRLSEINNSETDIDYTEVFGLCFIV